MFVVYYRIWTKKLLIINIFQEREGTIVRVKHRNIILLLLLLLFFNNAPRVAVAERPVCRYITR